MTTETTALPFDVTEYDPATTNFDRSTLSPGTDVWMTQFTFVILPKLKQGQPRPGAADAKRVLIDIYDSEVPEGSTPQIEANRQAIALAQPGQTIRVGRGKRMQRRIFDEPAGGPVE